MTDEPRQPEFPPIPEPPPAPPIPELLLRPVEHRARPAAGGGQHDLMKAASGYASAFTFIGAVLGFGLAGWAVDWFAGTGPWGLVVGFGLGIVGATTQLIREANRPLR